MGRDPFSYLSGTGLVKGVSKAAEGAAKRIAVKEHSRKTPARKPAPTKKPSVEGNESPAYERMEKKSLRGQTLGKLGK